ncbi:MAG: TatD family hydrolase [Bacteroidetes bacterium]|nr:TatD family hydrolase [Bacteroidota bacterium]
MQLIDTHCHIYADAFNTDRKEMIDRAVKEGINKLLMPAIDTTTHQAMLALEQEHPGICFSMMGLHPCSVKTNFKEELAVIYKYFEQRPFIAVGEIGLDFYWDLSFKEEQYQAFHKQIELALHYGIPIVIHSRESTDECIGIVKEHQRGKLKGVFHCFGGSKEQAQKIIDLGFYLGIGGVLTFKKAGLDVLMKGLNLNNIVLETDAPYLAPAPFRGKRNECSYVKYVAEKLAEIKQLPIQEVAAITTSNAQSLFSI